MKSKLLKEQQIEALFAPLARLVVLSSVLFLVSCCRKDEDFASCIVNTIRQILWWLFGLPDNN